MIVVITKLASVRSMLLKVYPGGNVDHFVLDLENMINLIDKIRSCILVVDINIDIIKYEDDRVLNYVTVLIYKYVPYITLPTRI